MKTPHKTIVFREGSRRSSWLLAGLTTLVLLLAAGRSWAADSATFYGAWVKPWTERPATSAALDNAELKAIVSIVAGEADANKIADMTPAERLAISYHIKVAATEIATNGACRDYFVSNTSNKSTEARQLSAADQQKLTNQLAQLPDDNAQLPLAGRRVVVQTRENGQWHIRVYDGRKLPAEVKSLLDQLANPYAQQL